VASMPGLRLKFSGVRDWRLSTKLVVLMAFVALAPLALVIWQGDTRARADLLADQRSDLQRTARETATRLDNRTLERKRQLLSFASSPLFTRFASDPTDKSSPAAEDARLSLINLMRTETVFESAFLAGPKGEVILSAGADPGPGIGDKDFFKASARGT